MKHSRRALLGFGAGTVGALAAGPGCGLGPRTSPYGPLLRLPYSAEPGRVAFGVGSDAPSPASMRDLLDEVLPDVDALSWLGAGDRVLIKVACNSDNPHPAVTDPDAVRALVGLLKDAGAGEVLVADQSGVAQVRRTRDGRRSSTREMMETNGLLAAIDDSDATAHFFDDAEWDEGWVRAEGDFDHHWGDDLYLPRVLEDVDHVIYLTRLSAHLIAGYTAGIKAQVGWMRDDSRLALHRDADVFFERLAEVGEFPLLKDKHRLTLTLGGAALLNVGPDEGAVHVFDAPWLVASTSLVDHDSLVVALLLWLDATFAAPFDLLRPYPGLSDTVNGNLVNGVWGPGEMVAYRPLHPPADPGPLEQDVMRARLCVVQGYRPRWIDIVTNATRLPPGLESHLVDFDGGVFVIREA